MLHVRMLCVTAKDIYINKWSFTYPCKLLKKYYMLISFLTSFGSIEKTTIPLNIIIIINV